MSNDERRHRLALRHSLTAPPASIAALARDLTGLHSSDPTTVYLSIAARHAAADPESIERVLYDERPVMRMLGMRRTLWVQHLDLAVPVQRGFTDALLVRERARAAGWFEDAGITPDGRAHIDRLGDRVLVHLADVGSATTRELNRTVPDLAEKYLPGGSPKWASPQSVGSRIIFLLATAGRIVRTRPLGTWISSQYRWQTTTNWLDAPLAPMDPATAHAAVVDTWLGSFGPATTTDVKWWLGSTVRDSRQALDRIGAVAVETEEGPAWLHPDDTDVVGPPPPTARLLPGLDPTTMGWKQRDWYLGDHGPALFDRNGNAGPTIWWDGRVVGGWAQRPDGEIALEYLETVPDECDRAVADEANDLQRWIGDIRFTPRFRTPTERRLTA